MNTPPLPQFQPQKDPTKAPLTIILWIVAACLLLPCLCFGGCAGLTAIGALAGNPDHKSGSGSVDPVATAKPAVRADDPVKMIKVSDFQLSKDSMFSYCLCVANNTSEVTYHDVRITVENLDKNGVITDEETARLDEMRPHQKYKFKIPIDSDSVKSFRVKAIEATGPDKSD